VQKYLIDIIDIFVRTLVSATVEDIHADSK